MVAFGFFQRYASLKKVIDFSCDKYFEKKKKHSFWELVLPYFRDEVFPYMFSEPPVSLSMAKEKFQGDFGYSIFLRFLLYHCGQSEVKKLAGLKRTSGAKRKKGTDEEEEMLSTTTVMEEAVQDNLQQVRDLQYMVGVRVGKAQTVLEKLPDAIASLVTLYDDQRSRIKQGIEILEKDLQGFRHELSSMDGKVANLSASFRGFVEDWRNIHVPELEIDATVAAGPLGVHEKSQLDGFDLDEEIIELEDDGFDQV